MNMFISARIKGIIVY